MRTTLDIDDDLLQAVKEIARREKRTAAAVLSDLARAGLRASSTSATSGDSFFGFEPIAAGGHLVTTDLVQRLADEDDL